MRGCVFVRARVCAAARVRAFQNRTGCHPARGLIRSLAPDATRGNGTIEIMRVPVPLVPGERVSLAAYGFGEFGHDEYAKYKVSAGRLRFRRFPGGCLALVILAPVRRGFFTLPPVSLLAN